MKNKKAYTKPEFYMEEFGVSQSIATCKTATKTFYKDGGCGIPSKGEKYDEVIAIGPVIMMKNVVAVTKPLNIKTSVSLNPIMIDGTGMCGGCRVLINGETKFACVDGPDFDGFAVDFDLLMRRQSMFKEEEHSCKIGRGGNNG